MSIKAKLFVVFAAIVLMLSVNIGIHAWGASQRGAALAKFERALQREALLRQIEQNLRNQVKEIILLSEMSFYEQGETFAESEKDSAGAFGYKDAISNLAEQLVALSDGETVAKASEFRNDVLNLSSAWAQFYKLIYRDPVQAIDGLVLGAEPLSERLLNQFLPAWKELEKQRVQEARQKSEAVNRMTGRTATVTFFCDGSPRAGTGRFFVPRPGRFVQQGRSPINRGKNVGAAENRVGNGSVHSNIYAACFSSNTRLRCLGDDGTCRRGRRRLFRFL